MALTDIQIKDLNYFLRRTAPVISRQVETFSRRLEGEVEMGSNDAQGYPWIMIYLQKGLGGCEELLKQIFRCVVQCQARYHLEYDLALFSFGWDDNKLTHSGHSYPCHYNSNYSFAVNELSVLAKNVTSPMSIVIPELFPLANPYGRKHNVESNDLLIIICQNKEVRVTEKVLEQLKRRRSKHVIWLFVDTNSVEIETNGYYPGFI